MIEIWRKSAEIMLHGDYYPPTQFSTSNENWDRQVAYVKQLRRYYRLAFRMIAMAKGQREALTRLQNRKAAGAYCSVNLLMLIGL